MKVRITNPETFWLMMFQLGYY